jgi:hypothetical protein
MSPAIATTTGAQVSSQLCCFDVAQLDCYLREHCQHFKRYGTPFSLKANRCLEFAYCYIPSSLTLRQFLQQRTTFLKPIYNRDLSYNLEPIEESVLGPFQPYFAQRNVMLGFFAIELKELYSKPFFWLKFSDVMNDLRVPSFPYRVYIITLYGRDKLCGRCGKFYDENESSLDDLVCHFHVGELEETLTSVGAGWEMMDCWSCCHYYPGGGGLNPCKTGPHVPLLLNGFAPTLTHWEQIRLILAWKRECRAGEAEAGGLFLLQEIIDVIVFALVELNDAEFYKK